MCQTHYGFIEFFYIERITMKINFVIFGIFSIFQAVISADAVKDLPSE